MFSIGEFARYGGVSIRTLRHYDEIGLLRPAPVDQATGYRSYSAAQLEHELQQHANQLLGVEARLRSIAREDDMPADDIVAKTIPATGVVVIAGRAPGFGAANIVPVVNQLDAQFDQLGIYERVKQADPASSSTNASKASRTRTSRSAWACP